MDILFWCFLLVVGGISVDRATISTLIRTPQRQIGMLACALVLALLWVIKAGILPNLSIHILGLTATTLILGWRLAMLAALLASGLLLGFSYVSVEQFPAFLLFSAWLPIWFSYGVFMLVYHRLPRHLFVYIFVCSFLCAALASCLKIVTSAGYFWLIGMYDADTLMHNYVFFCALIWFPEATINGMAITLLAIYRPHWVKTFYDEEYLSQ